MDPETERNIESDSNTSNGQSTPITDNPDKPQKTIYRWKGKIVKESTYRHRLACVESGKRRKKEKEPEVKIPVEGRRLVDLKLLAKHLNCTSCGDVLSLRNIKSETRRGLASIFHVKCHNCDIINFVPSSGKRGTDENPKSRFYDVNCEFVQGSIETGITANRLNKLLGFMKIPHVQRQLYRRYKDETLASTAPAAVRTTVDDVPEASAASMLPTEDDPKTIEMTTEITTDIIYEIINTEQM